MKTVIIKYNAGNVQSVLFALRRLGVDAILSGESEEIRSADKVIFPGVGEASSAMRYLEESGLRSLIPSLKQPVLGICLGMQLMGAHSEEGNTECLGIVSNRVMKFRGSMKIPQVGWNICKHEGENHLFKGIAREEYFYFVHSYYMEPVDGVIGVSDYGVNYAAAIRKSNFYAVQFHPERSGAAGERVLSNFLQL